MIRRASLVKRLFLFSGLFFWTGSTLAKEESPQGVGIDISSFHSTEDQPSSGKTVDEKHETGNFKEAILEMAGLNQKHSLIFASWGPGWAEGAINGKTETFEIGYERPYDLNTKLGFYFTHSKTMYNEHFVFKNTGYFESRSNEVSIRSSGLQARYGIFRYIDLRGGLGISSTRIDVNNVETDSPAPSTAIGYSDTYPIGTHLRVGLSATKTFNSFGFAVELSHEESAVGMSHSVSSNSLNFIIRYFYNRFRIEQPDQLDDSNTPRQNEAHPFNLSPHF